MLFIDLVVEILVWLDEEIGFFLLWLMIVGGLLFGMILFVVVWFGIIECLGGVVGGLLGNRVLGMVIGCVCCLWGGSVGFLLFVLVLFLGCWFFFIVDGILMGILFGFCLIVILFFGFIFF